MPHSRMLAFFGGAAASVAFAAAQGTASESSASAALIGAARTYRLEFGGVIGDLTGQRFGTKAKKWREWLARRPRS